MVITRDQKDFKLSYNTSSEVWSTRLYKLINLISDTIMEKVMNINLNDEIVTEFVVTKLSLFEIYLFWTAVSDG